MRLQITIEGDALERLRRSAEADLRPVGWQAKALLLRALDASSSSERAGARGEAERIPAGAERQQGGRDAA